MTPKNSVLHTLESLVRTRDPSTPFVSEAARLIRGDRVDGVGRLTTDAASPAGEAISKRAVAEPSSPHDRIPEDDAEYEEVDDLIYERTGTLSFSYPLRSVASGERATHADSDKPEAIRARSAGSSLAGLARLVSGLRAASATTPGVSLLATVDVVGGEPASTAKRRERSTSSRGRGQSQRCILARGAAPRRAQSRARGWVVCPAAECQADDKTSLLAKQRTHRSYGQRLLAEVRRIPLAKRPAALGVMAAVVVAEVLVAMATRVPRRVASEEAAPRSSVAAVVAERAPASAPAPINSSRASVMTEDGATPVRLHWPALDATLTAGHAKRAKAPALSKARASMPPRSHAPCDCLPGDPLCGCID
jgi:hypothetical protein